MTAQHVALPRPVLTLQRAPIDHAQGNDNKPNKVAPPEMRPLQLSIARDGIAVPVELPVHRLDDDLARPGLDQPFLERPDRRAIGRLRTLPQAHEALKAQPIQKAGTSSARRRGCRSAAPPTPVPSAPSETAVSRRVDLRSQFAQRRSGVLTRAFLNAIPAKTTKMMDATMWTGPSDASDWRAGWPSRRRVRSPASCQPCCRQPRRRHLAIGPPRRW